MQTQALWSALSKTAGVVALVLVFANSVWAQSNEKLLYGFTFKHADGEFPTAPVTFDVHGNLYGTTDLGGTNANGTVVKLTRSSRGWKETVIYRFLGGNDGTQPWGGVVLDGAGNLYGTTIGGGTGGGGTVFQLTPHIGKAWTETVLHGFSGLSDGSTLYSGLVFDQAGNLYGTTFGGGGGNCVDTLGCGVVFELTPKSGGGWTEKTIYAFQGGTDGAYMLGGVILDAKGNLYGTTELAGVHGSGTVFQLTPHLDGSWTESTLYSFSASGDGMSPLAGLTFDHRGNLYGTTSLGGANNAGTVFELKRGKRGWTEAVLHSFDSNSDGSMPYAGVTFDKAGNLYGATSTDGTQGAGAIFRLTRSGSGWTETVLHSFSGGKDGGGPLGNLLFDAKGNLYGTTEHGGPGLEGVVFQFAP
jgi:uncharacterized repeat protein (TIGR03803 family)